MIKKASYYIFSPNKLWCRSIQIEIIRLKFFSEQIQIYFLNKSKMYQIKESDVKWSSSILHKQLNIINFVCHFTYTLLGLPDGKLVEACIDREINPRHVHKITSVSGSNLSLYSQSLSGSNLSLTLFSVSIWFRKITTLSIIMYSSFS
jgi:hypothetical protein